MLVEFNPLCAELDLATMDEEVWESYLDVQKRKHNAFIESERKTEQARQEVLENERLETIRIQKENEKLVAENRKKDELIESERLKIQDIQRKEAEEKANAEAKIQLELTKGDSLKIKDLINDLQNLKSKYSFKSKKNKLIYQSVSVLIDKVITFITK
tara:strand:- start:833 stop:1306 length:474 start_codon:yes stop_codon:yes gene_type:complete